LGVKINLPEIEGPITETEDSLIHGKHGVDHFDYCAEEYFVSGSADTYESVSMADAQDMSQRDNIVDLGKRTFERTVTGSDIPYTTRLLVYKPKDPAKFTGNCIVETFHPIYGGIMATWGNDHFFHMENGDIYVGVQHPVTFAGLKRFNAERYASLKMHNATLLWGCLAQVGALMKSDDGRSPLKGLEVSYQFMTGLSFTGVATATFANYHHESAKLEDGGNIYDGYVPINNAMYNRPLDVPVIRIMSLGDFDSFNGLNNRREDSDDMNSRYRLYELAGSPHTTTWLRRKGRAKFPKTLILTERGANRPPQEMPAFEEGEKPNDFPNGIFFAGAFKNLYDWVRNGTAPPAGDRIATNADGSWVLDEHGNVVGGIRSPYVDVPIAKYGSKGLMGFKIPFDGQKKKSLYDSHGTYVEMIIRETDKLVKNRWIQKSEAPEIIDEAKESETF